MAQVEKIYSLKTIGFEQIMSELDALSKKFVEVKKAKQDYEKQLADNRRRQKEVSDEIRAEKQAIEELKLAELELKKGLKESAIAELELKKAIKEKSNEAKAAALAQKEQQAAQKASLAGNAAEVNSIKAVRAARAELNQAIIATRVGAPVEFRGLILPYQQANDTLKKLTEQSNAYARQFQKDGTLVGEYTTGIIQAFKDMGIDDLVKGQVTRANGELRGLNDQFEQLKRELQSVKAAGAGSFDNIERELASVRVTGVAGFDAIEQKVKELGNAGSFSLDKIEQVLQEIKATGNTAFNGIERELIEIRTATQGAFAPLEAQLLENRRAAIALEQQIGHLNTSLRGTGDIGNQITKGLSAGFKEMRGQLAQFILSYVGFQAALQGITTAFNNTIEIEGLNAAMKNVSGTAEELAINQKFLADTSDRLGLETIAATGAFKNFYAAATQAGIGSDSVRNIFEAAAQASATLGNSQEQTNGILLAFGQIASKGKVQAEELTGQIGERLPGALAIAARAMGVTQQELFKMMQNGQLLANEFLPKFAAELNKTFGGDNQGKIETLSAKVNRLKNIFTEAIQSNNAGISALISGIIFVITGLLNVLPAVTIALGAYAAVWAVANASMIAARVSLLASNAAILAGIAADTIATTWKASLAAATNFLTAAMGRAAVTSGILRTAITLLSGPIGIVLTVIGLLGISMQALGNSASKVVGSLNDMQRAQKAINDVTREANLSIVKEQGELNKLYKAATDTSNSLATIRDAKQKLLAQYPDYFKATSAEQLTNKDLKDGYDALTESIKRRAFAQASAKIAAEAQAKVDQVAAAQIRVDTALADSSTRVKGLYGGRLRVIKDLAEEEVKILEQTSNGVVKAMKTISGNYTGEVQFFEKDTKLVQAALERERVTREKTTKVYDDLAARYNKPLPKDTTAVPRTLLIIKSELDQVSKDFEKTVKDTPEYTRLKAQKEKLEKEIAEFNNNPTARKASAAKLTAQMRDDFSIIESNLRRELALQETKVIELKKSNQYTFEEEVKNANVTQEINIRYINQKIDKLERLKSLNAAEKASLETFRKERADIELKTVNDIQEIHNREFTERQTRLRNQLDAEVAAIKEADVKVQNDPSKTATERAQSKLDADTAVLALYVKFNRDVDALEKALIQQTTRNSREIVKAQQGTAQDVIEDRRKVAQARIADIETEGEQEVVYQTTKYQKLRNVILSNDRLTQQQREIQLDRLAKAERVTILTGELKALEKELAEKKEMLRRGDISEAEYNKAHLAVVQKAGELEQALREAQQSRLEALLNRRARTFEDLTAREAQRGAIKLFNIDEDEQEDAAAAIGEAISQSFDLAQNAMHAYYDAEQQRVRDSLALNLERLDQEKEQVKARATSQAESEKIDKDFAARKRTMEKAAGEEIKKARRAELRIALVTEIANIAVAAARFGLPFGPVIFGVMSALALGRYALGVGQINSQQFDLGGNVPRKGGVIKGRSHAQGGVKFNYDYEAEGQEISIIRTKNAPRNKIFEVKGTIEQIASQINVIGGGVAFAPGAKLKRFELGGNLGNTLNAPVFVPSQGNNIINNRNGLTEEQLTKIMAKVDEGISATNNRIDRLQVHVNARDVVKTNDQYTKAAQVGTL